MPSKPFPKMTSFLEKSRLANGSTGRQREMSFKRVTKLKLEPLLDWQPDSYGNSFAQRRAFARFVRGAPSRDCSRSTSDDDEVRQRLGSAESKRRSRRDEAEAKRAKKTRKRDLSSSFGPRRRLLDQRRRGEPEAPFDDEVEVITIEDDSDDDYERVLRITETDWEKRNRIWAWISSVQNQEVTIEDDDE
jgi:hypothetical protein